MQSLLCTPASTLGLEISFVEITIVCIVPLIMMLSHWASKSNSTRPMAEQDAQDMPAMEQHRNEKTESQDASERLNEEEMKPTEQVLSQDILQLISASPLEVRCMVAQYLSNANVAAASSVCSSSYEAFWESEGVWLILGMRDDFSLGRSGVAEFTREAFRHAAYRIDCGNLAVLAASPQSGADVNVFKEACHVMRGLMPSDAREIQFLCTLMRPALESLNFTAAGAAEEFLRRAHSRTDIFSSEDYEILNSAYDYALLQHNLMMETMEEHMDELDAQMQSVEQQVCHDHWSLIMDQ